MINFYIVFSIIGKILVLLSGLMLSCLIFTFHFNSNDLYPILLSCFITFAIGLFFWFITKDKSQKIDKREAYLIVSFGWISISFCSGLPYLLSDYFPCIADVYFESVSGLTTTGASILKDIEIIPQGLLFWRSLTQWIGGMGIVVLTVAIFPLLGVGGVELFVDESPGPMYDKIHPKIKDTAKTLWMLYVLITLVIVIYLCLNGMTVFDSINHAFTTISTGGFSTKNSSIAHYSNPAIHYGLTFFMFISGLNFTVIYYLLKAKFNKAWQSDEFKVYTLGVLFLTIILSILVQNITNSPFELAFREVSFMVVSIITTTGFVLADYTIWTPFITLIFFILLFVGACGGSTAGGIKIIRHIVFFKNTLKEFKRLIHPNAVIRIKIDKAIVQPRVLTHIMIFLLIYLILFVGGTLVMTIILDDFNDPIIAAMGSVATCLGNVGPAIGEFGPVYNFASVPDLGKWFLISYMIFGRLELFSILILFSPYFWRSN